MNYQRMQALHGATIDFCPEPENNWNPELLLAADSIFENIFLLMNF